jgi:hypothetical protein
MLLVFLGSMCLVSLGAIVIRMVDSLERAARAVERMAEAVPQPSDDEPVSDPGG